MTTADACSATAGLSSASRLHVVVDARTFSDHYPGIGRYVSELTQALAELNDLRLTLLVDPRAVSTFHSLPDVERAFVASGLRSPSQQWTVPVLLNRLHADVYHSPYYLMPYRTPCPTVVTFYDLIPLIAMPTAVPPAGLPPGAPPRWWRQPAALSPSRSAPPPTSRE